MFEGDGGFQVGHPTKFPEDQLFEQITNELSVKRWRGQVLPVGEGGMMVRRAESWKELGLAEELQNKDSEVEESRERAQGGGRFPKDEQPVPLYRKYSGPFNGAHT